VGLHSIAAFQKMKNCIRAWENTISRYLYFIYL